MNQSSLKAEDAIDLLWVIQRSLQSSKNNINLLLKHSQMSNCSTLISIFSSILQYWSNKQHQDEVVLNILRCIALITGIDNPSTLGNDQFLEDLKDLLTKFTVSDGSHHHHHHQPVDGTNKQHYLHGGKNSVVDDIVCCILKIFSNFRPQSGMELLVSYSFISQIVQIIDKQKNFVVKAMGMRVLCNISQIEQSHALMIQAHVPYILISCIRLNNSSSNTVESKQSDVLQLKQKALACIHNLTCQSEQNIKHELVCSSLLFYIKNFLQTILDKTQVTKLDLVKQQIELEQENIKQQQAQQENATFDQDNMNNDLPEEIKAQQPKLTQKQSIKIIERLNHQLSKQKGVFFVSLVNFYYSSSGKSMLYDLQVVGNIVQNLCEQNPTYQYSLGQLGHIDALVKLLKVNEIYSQDGQLFLMNQAAGDRRGKSRKQQQLMQQYEYVQKQNNQLYMTSFRALQTVCQVQSNKEYALKQTELLDSILDILNFIDQNQSNQNNDLIRQQIMDLMNCLCSCYVYTEIIIEHKQLIQKLLGQLISKSSSEWLILRLLKFVKLIHISGHDTFFDQFLLFTSSQDMPGTIAENPSLTIGQVLSLLLRHNPLYDQKIIKVITKVKLNIQQPILTHSSPSNDVINHDNFSEIKEYSQNFNKNFDLMHDRFNDHYNNLNHGETQARANFHGDPKDIITLDKDFNPSRQNTEERSKIGENPYLQQDISNQIINAFNEKSSSLQNTGSNVGKVNAFKKSTHHMNSTQLSKAMAKHKSNYLVTGDINAQENSLNNTGQQAQARNRQPSQKQKSFSINTVSNGLGSNKQKSFNTNPLGQSNWNQTKSSLENNNQNTMEESKGSMGMQFGTIQRSSKIDDSVYDSTQGFQKPQFKSKRIQSSLGVRKGVQNQSSTISGMQTSNNQSQQQLRGLGYSQNEGQSKSVQKIRPNSSYFQGSGPKSSIVIRQNQLKGNNQSGNTSNQLLQRNIGKNQNNDQSESTFKKVLHKNNIIIKDMINTNTNTITQKIDHVDNPEKDKIEESDVSRQTSLNNTRKFLQRSVTQLRPRNKFVEQEISLRIKEDNMDKLDFSNQIDDLDQTIELKDGGKKEQGKNIKEDRDHQITIKNLDKTNSRSYSNLNSKLSQQASDQQVTSGQFKFSNKRSQQSTQQPRGRSTANFVKNQMQSSQSNSSNAQHGFQNLNIHNNRKTLNDKRMSRAASNLRANLENSKLYQNNSAAQNKFKNVEKASKKFYKPYNQKEFNTLDIAKKQSIEYQYSNTLTEETQMDQYDSINKPDFHQSINSQLLGQGDICLIPNPVSPYNHQPVLDTKKKGQSMIDIKQNSTKSPFKSKLEKLGNSDNLKSQNTMQFQQQSTNINLPGINFNPSLAANKSKESANTTCIQNQQNYQQEMTNLSSQINKNLSSFKNYTQNPTNPQYMQEVYHTAMQHQNGPININIDARFNADLDFADNQVNPMNKLSQAYAIPSYVNQVDKVLKDLQVKTQQLPPLNKIDYKKYLLTGKVVKQSPPVQSTGSKKRTSSLSKANTLISQGVTLNQEQILQSYMQADIADKDSQESKKVRHYLSIGMPEAKGIVKQTQGCHTMNEILVWFLKDFSELLQQRTSTKDELNTVNLNIQKTLEIKFRQLQLAICSASICEKFISLLCILIFENYTQIQEPLNKANIVDPPTSLQKIQQIIFKYF